MSGRFESIARGLACTLAGLAVLAFFAVAFARLGYPFGLEWMEGGALASVARVLGPGSLYDAPTATYVPFIYPPAYFYAASALASVIGQGFSALRLTSIVATAGSLASLCLLGLGGTGRRSWGLVAAGTFAATYELSGSWFDLARVDALFLAFSLAAIALAQRENQASSSTDPACKRASLVRQVACGIALVLACSTKQSAIVLAAAVCFHAVLSWRFRGGWLVATLVASLGISTVFLEWFYGGWYLYYQWLPATHAIVGPAWWSFWALDLGAALPVCVAFTSYGLWAVRSERRTFVFRAVLLAGVLALSWASRLHVGGYANVLMPMHAVLAWLSVAGAHAAIHNARAGASRAWVGTAVWMAVAAQLLWLAYDPRGMVPSKADREEGQRMVERLATLDGPVLVPFHAYLGDRAGRGSWMTGNAGGDVLRGPESEVREDYVADLLGAIRERRFAAIVIDGSAIDRWSGFQGAFGEELERQYRIAGRVFEDPSVFWPVTGARTRPEYVLTPRPPSR